VIRQPPRRGMARRSVVAGSGWPLNSV